MKVTPTSGGCLQTTWHSSKIRSLVMLSHVTIFYNMLQQRHGTTHWCYDISWGRLSRCFTTITTRAHSPRLSGFWSFLVCIHQKEMTHYEIWGQCWKPLRLYVKPLSKPFNVNVVHVPACSSFCANSYSTWIFEPDVVAHRGHIKIAWFLDVLGPIM